MHSHVWIRFKLSNVKGLSSSQEKITILNIYILELYAFVFIGF